MKIRQLKSKIIAYIVSMLVPDYDSVKADNEKLRKDIFNLVEKEGDIEGVETKIKWKILFGTERTVTFGDVAKKDSKFNGIFN